MAAGGSEAERQAVREAVRKQRRKFARSLSQDTPLLPMVEDPVAEEMAEASSVSTGRDHEQEKGASRSRSRSLSMSPSRRRVAFSAEHNSSGGGGSGEFGFSEGAPPPFNVCLVFGWVVLLCYAAMSVGGYCEMSKIYGNIVSGRIELRYIFYFTAH